jgi:ubiquinone biosynthesis protein
MEYSSSRVLTMDYVGGHKVTGISRLKQTETDLYPLLDELIKVYIKQIVVDGFVHADPHPGNIRLTFDNKLALVDLGMVAKFTPRLQEKLMQLLLGIARQDGDAVINILLSISEVTEYADLEKFRRIANRHIMDNQQKSARELQSGRLLIQMNRIAAENGIHIAVELNILGKVLLNLDQIVAVLAPDIDLQKVIRKHVQKMMQDNSLRT